jgi:hypothetical protein
MSPAAAQPALAPRCDLVGSGLRTGTRPRAEGRIQLRSQRNGREVARQLAQRRHGWSRDNTRERARHLRNHRARPAAGRRGAEAR